MSFRIFFHLLFRYVHVFNYFTPAKRPNADVPYVEDISYGQEKVPVSAINLVDNNFPEYVEYRYSDIDFEIPISYSEFRILHFLLFCSTVRLPQKNVNIPLDEGFLTCCDCTDDCQDKEKCSCWQLTIRRYVNLSLTPVSLESHLSSLESHSSLTRV